MPARAWPDDSVPSESDGADLGQAEDNTWLDGGLETSAKAAAENFPVALKLLPGRYRRHLMAAYCFARTVDDVGDLAPPAERLRLLGELADDVRRLYAVHPPGPEPRLAVVSGLADLVSECQVPIEPFLALIRANEQDQAITRYQTFDELLGYCRLSANPVGHIVLHIFGCYTQERARLSDYVCTGLQIAEHLQDVGEDVRNGRIYLPAEDLLDYGCTEEDLLAPTAGPGLRRLIAFEADRTAGLIDSGAPLLRTLRGMSRAAVAGYVAGGRAALAAIAAADYDVLAATRRPGKGRTAAELVTALVRAR